MSSGTPSPLMQPRPAQELEWFVIVETGSLAGKRVSIGAASGVLTLGRDPGCAIPFDPNQERMVGRRHAHLEVRSDGVYLIDDSSANGTFKDGQPITEVRLQHGDRFQLGGEVEGMQGPWISIHMPIAVHVAPPRTEGATLITRPPVLSTPTIPPPSTAAESTPPPAFSSQVPRRESVLPLDSEPAPRTPPAYPHPYHERPVSIGESEIARAIVPTDTPALAVDAQQNQRRTQLIRQLAVIVFLLALACGVGVLLSQQGGSDPGSDPVAYER